MELRECMKAIVISIPVNKKEGQYANSRYILRNLFVCALIRNEDDEISSRPALKLGMDLLGRN